MTLPPGARHHTNCRVCKAALPAPYLDLGLQPLANGLVGHFDYVVAGPAEPMYPLAVALCENCGLSQLTVVVDPKILYTHYRFASGVSTPWKVHTWKLAEQIKEEMGDGGFVVDIAANDGTQLQGFKGNGDWKILGVEPSDVPTLMVGTYGNEVHAKIPMLRTFWSQIVADNIRVNDGLADVIIAQNVLGHVDDAIGFLKAAKSVLKPNGYVIVEVPNVGDLINNMAFDTIYHEHLSYWSGFALRRAAREAGLSLDRVERFPELHGGSVRYWLEHSNGEAESETWPASSKPYENFAERVANSINLTASIIGLLGKKKFLAWGASAKGAVMMNAVHNRWPGIKLPSDVIDQTPEKQGMLTPGVHIPVIAPPDDLSDVDVLWILSWNWLERLRYEAETRGFKGKYLVTSPKPKLFAPESYMSLHK